MPGTSAEEVVAAWESAIESVTPQTRSETDMAFSGEASRGRVIVSDANSAWEVSLPEFTGGDPGPEYGYVDEILIKGLLGLDPASEVTYLDDAGHSLGENDVVIFMPPISGAELERIYDGSKLPRKSTAFGPKPLTGVFLAQTPCREVSDATSPTSE